MLTSFLVMALAAQPLDPVEQYERRFEQKTTPPAIYIPQTTRPPIRFDQPFRITPQPSERRYITPEGKLITCRNTGPWVYCF